MNTLARNGGFWIAAGTAAGTALGMALGVASVDWPSVSRSAFSAAA